MWLQPARRGVRARATHDLRGSGPLHSAESLHINEHARHGRASRSRRGPRRGRRLARAARATAPPGRRRRQDAAENAPRDLARHCSPGGGPRAARAQGPGSAGGLAEVCPARQRRQAIGTAGLRSLRHPQGRTSTGAYPRSVGGDGGGGRQERASATHKRATCVLHHTGVGTRAGSWAHGGGSDSARVLAPGPLMHRAYGKQRRTLARPSDDNQESRC